MGNRSDGLLIIKGHAIDLSKIVHIQPVESDLSTPWIYGFTIHYNVHTKVLIFSDGEDVDGEIGKKDMTRMRNTIIDEWMDYKREIKNGRVK